MGCIIKNLILLTILSLVMKPGLSIQGLQQVPCVFFFGDSGMDNGNNNNLNTLAKVDYQPYGIDYPDGPTGRFTNGANVADILTLLLGFTKEIPPFATAKQPDIFKGVNYASGAAGILDETGNNFGDHFSMDRQLLHHKTIIDRIARSGRNQDYLKQCLYIVYIGSNDYINNYYLPKSHSRASNSPDKFAEILIRRFSRQLKELYDLGARKMAVFGLGPIGCIPQELKLYSTDGTSCVQYINDAVQLFNTRLKPLIFDLNSSLDDAHFTFINVTSISTGDPSIIGVRVSNAPCCIVWNVTGQCLPNREPCRNRNEYLFWDNYHATALVNFLTIPRAYIALLPSDAEPVDIRTLIHRY